MPSTKKERSTRINGYKVIRSKTGKTMFEFLSEAMWPKQAALDAAQGIAKEFRSQILVVNTKSGFTWIVFRNGDVHAVGTQKK